MKEAGLEKKTARLRVTTATNLLQGKHEEKLIHERTGHISSALFAYEKAEKQQRIAVSSTLGPCVLKDSEAQSKKDYDIADEELDRLLSEFDWSQFDNQVQRHIAPEQLMLSSNNFSNCTVNISFSAKY